MLNHLLGHKAPPISLGSRHLNLCKSPNNFLAPGWGLSLCSEPRVWGLLSASLGFKGKTESGLLRNDHATVSFRSSSPVPHPTLAPKGLVPLLCRNVLEPSVWFLDPQSPTPGPEQPARRGQIGAILGSPQEGRLVLHTLKLWQ